uniref:Putative secreted peptide n=1 Tax=Anopheles braziliensis TaxID=58242 RepID=A0A2M3ZX90_9DIPT
MRARCGMRACCTLCSRSSYRATSLLSLLAHSGFAQMRRRGFPFAFRSCRFHSSCCCHSTKMVLRKSLIKENKVNTLSSVIGLASE